MTDRIRDNQFKAFLFIILFIVLILHTMIVDAQSFQFKSKNPYKGFVANFGTRSSKINSTIQKINQSSLLQTGGQIGLIFGNSIVRSKIGLLGYYSSAGNTAGTVDLYESNASVNFYPLSWISKKITMVEPYITAGLDYDQFKFYGYYLNQEPGQINYSHAEAPYLGKMKQVNGTVGMGIELKLMDRYDFVHLFSEIRYGHNLSAKAKNAEFMNTEISNQTQIILGICFGAHR